MAAWKITISLLGLSASLGVLGGACTASPVEPSTDDAAEADEAITEPARPDDHRGDDDRDMGRQHRERCFRRCYDRYGDCMHRRHDRARCESDRNHCIGDCSSRF